ncbi:ArdC-like ssDNA-binding domain-containing protein [Alkalihalobacillus sp. BA299]|uniref:ArdC-like ssDNA-binding domain-containing protein n=1 Tax=Alkalihalobacillus sp. BA299 TaxID=2815938 RepID=UPI001AD9BC45|nr:ArdC family protein [Alkalihalobacillus sp. BA299]
MKKHFKKKGDYPSAKERVEELIKTLEEGVSNFQYDPEEFKALLEMKALMPNYSFRNLLVAKAQLPEASFIAPFKRWGELGRKVKKGSKSIRIFAPRFKKVEEEEAGNGEKHKLVGFIAVPVFDVSQTEGEPLPIDRFKIQLEGDCPEAKEIIKMVEEISDFPISYGDTGDANGFYSQLDHSITVSDKLSINHRAKTLVHEYVHSQCHQLGDKSSSKEREVVAEGCAFVVCNYFGLDTADYSFRYVKGWSQGDEDALMTFGSQICDVSGKIIHQFEVWKEAKQNQEQVQITEVA